MRNSLKLNTLYLKIIATALMVVDHIACFLIDPSSAVYWIMRIIGRISAPLFWFCFVEGYKKTSNKKNYAKRLFIATIVMAFGNLVCLILLGDNLSIGISATQPNIFLTMFLMAIAIECIRRISKSKKVISKVWFVILSILICLAVGCGAEYGWFAVCSILCLYFIQHKIAKYILFVMSNVIICILYQNIVQTFMILSVLLMMMYSEERPKRKLKWSFYIFYPAHLWLLMIIGKLI